MNSRNKLGVQNWLPDNDNMCRYTKKQRRYVLQTLSYNEVKYNAVNLC
jgi:hypothetical protein